MRLSVPWLKPSPLLRSGDPAARLRWSMVYGVANVRSVAQCMAWCRALSLRLLAAEQQMEREWGVDFHSDARRAQVIQHAVIDMAQVADSVRPGTIAAWFREHRGATLKPWRAALSLASLLRERERQRRPC